MERQQILRSNLFPLISFLVALLVTVNSIASFGNTTDIKTGLVGFLILLGIAVIHLYRLVIQKEGRRISTAVLLFCILSIAVIGFHLIELF
jgi:hypothetical protein